MCKLTIEQLHILQLHKLPFTTAHFNFTTAQIVINSTLKYALYKQIVSLSAADFEIISLATIAYTSLRGLAPNSGGRRLIAVVQGSTLKTRYMNFIFVT